MDFNGKKVTVVGLGKSGLAAAKLLKDLGAEVRVTEISSNPEVMKRVKQLEELNVAVELGKHDVNILDNQDLIIASPGIPWQASPLQYAKDYHIPVIGEVELGYLCCNLPIIAISGTNGKTTVCNMLNRVLNKAGSKSILCGNVGIPFTQIIRKGVEDLIIILEVSSFQLERIVSFRPFIGILLNVDSDHLDRHKDIYSYKRSKYNMFLNQTRDDWSIIVNPDFKFINKRPKSIFLTDDEIFSADVSFYRDIDRNINIKYDQVFKNPNIDINQKVVLVILSLLGKDIKIYIDEILNFKNLEHRLEFVANINGISFINDSKSTNVSSTNWALSKYDNVLLIAGGRNKNLDFNLISPHVREKIKCVITMGEASEDIKDSFSKFCSVYEVDDLAEAVKKSYSLAYFGDNVLFSPMCASFDMFKDYEERGNRFKEEVYKMIR